ncbi:DUF6531 domain-containing protein [Glaciimonas sp. Gout2]|uniref:RHS repeat domain-containing protein n=1 Tax=unclassified Glaciimonas TaxID=2644401 RepID=UPI002B238E51|nr:MULTISPECIES: DUF6531 domain-containing protein [unclassified Glaciimonas]MEB0013535.1 DUF6531 domain-containing protein [Glaciimonas sp. Cout2]MEB0084651.1 DUF6531 domain-containing protein [Glaciimonas sp. Gout2]
MRFIIYIKQHIESVYRVVVRTQKEASALQKYDPMRGVFRGLSVAILIAFVSMGLLSNEVSAKLISKEMVPNSPGSTTHFFITERYDNPDEGSSACLNFAKKYGYSSGYCHIYYDRETKSGAVEGGWLCGDKACYLGEFYYCHQDTHYNSATNSCQTTSPIDLQAGNPKSNAQQCPKCDVGDPINPATGNNWRAETDYASNSAGGLTFTRTYNGNALSTDASAMRATGKRWTGPLDRKAVQIPNPRQTAYQPQCYQWTRGEQTFCADPSTPLSKVIDGLLFTRPDGKSTAFGLVGSAWIGDDDGRDRVSATVAVDGVTSTGWTYFSAHDGSTERYSDDGKLLSVTTRAGTTQTMTYSDGKSNDTALSRLPADAPMCTNVSSGVRMTDGLLLCVTDNWGQQLQFEYDSRSRLSKMITPGNQSYHYAYDGPSGGCAIPDQTNTACAADNLTQVTYPDGNSKTYWYNEATQINGGNACTGYKSVAPGFGTLMHALTSIVDENGARYTDWTYDCMGRATGNQLIGGLQKTVLRFGQQDSATGASTTTITDTIGDPANPHTNIHQFDFRMLHGVSKITAIDQPCAECGPAAAYTYDANANVATSTDFSGVVTSYAYDLSRNLETSRTEATGTAHARTITTEWHPTYNVPTTIAAPGQVTTFTYDASGNALSKTISAGTTRRSWSYTYNATGQLESVTEPDGDGVNLTQLAYDAAGNLSTITNGLAQVRLFGDYNINGRVGRITEDNGTTTILHYAPRGWLTSQVVTIAGVAHSTRYRYDKVGQLIAVTLPDANVLTYHYDDAHRLTSIKDSLGNTIRYKLDLWGNRMGEDATDPGGVLGRTIQRTHDTINRLQQVSGAAE